MSYKLIDDVDQVLELSRENQQLILKHSTACPICSRAKRETDAFLADHPGLEPYLVVVQDQRDVSSELADKLGIEHETPQFLVVRDGEAVRHWNHHEITKDALEEALG